jgi:UV DNA damage endonuclease
MTNLGYACINMELRKKKIFAGRTCRMDKFKKQGLQYVGELGIQNLKDLYEIVQWNEKNGIKVFRIGSDIFPWSSEYEYSDLPQYKEACALLKKIGDYATKVGQRLSFHPGPFNILGSSNPDVVKRTMIDLRHHSEIFDLMGFEPSVYNKINIHIGAAYKDKMSVLNRWCENYEKLDTNTRKRITVENDDKPSLYTTYDLYQHVFKQVGVPIVFDFHHHSCHPGELSHSEALGLAIKTWPTGIKPVVHYSSARQIEDSKAKIQAHADYVYEDIDTFGYDVDVMLECKMKEKALLEYRRKNAILIENKQSYEKVF